MSNEISVNIIFSEKERSVIKKYARDNFIPEEYVPFHLTKMLINQVDADMEKFMIKINGKVTVPEKAEAKVDEPQKDSVQVSVDDFKRKNPAKTAKRKNRVKPASIISDSSQEKPKPQMTVDPGTKIDDIGLTNRSVNALKKKLNIFYVDELAKISEDDLYNTQGLGKKSLKEIFEARESILSRGRDGLIQESFDPEDSDTVKRTFGLINKIEEIERDIDGFRALKKIFQDASSLDNEQVKQVMLSNGFKPTAHSNVDHMFDVLLSCFPAQGEQIQQIYDLTSELGESKFIAENERPVAFCGKKLFDLSLSDAEGLINELESEFQAEDNDQAPANPFNSEPDDFF